MNEYIIPLWVVIGTLLVSGVFLIFAGYVIGRYHGKSGGPTRSKLRADINELHVRVRQAHMLNEKYIAKWLRLLRDLRFSQKANERHKRANKRLRGYLDVADAWPKPKLRRDHKTGRYMRRDGSEPVRMVPRQVEVTQTFKTGKGFSGLGGGSANLKGEEGASIDLDGLAKKVKAIGK